jgi:hypothetical protein
LSQKPPKKTAMAPETDVFFKQDGKGGIPGEIFLEHLGLPTFHPYVTDPSNTPSVENNYIGKNREQVEILGLDDWSILNYIMPSHQYGEASGQQVAEEPSTFLTRDVEAHECLLASTPPFMDGRSKSCAVDEDHDIVTEYQSRHIATAIDKMLSHLSLEMAEIGPSMWSLVYLIASMVMPLIFLSAIVFLLGRLIHKLVLPNEKQACSAKSSHHQQQYNAICGMAMLSLAFMFQDTMYFQEWRLPVFAAFFGCVSVAPFLMQQRQCDDAISKNNKRGPVLQSERSTPWSVFLHTTLPILFFTFTWFVLKAANHDLPTSIKPGLYFSQHNTNVASIIAEWPSRSRSYDSAIATPWILNGDMRTGLPFLFNDIPEVTLVRR